jgi:hypothetical protein
MQMPSVRLTVRHAMVAIALAALSLGGMRAWRRHVYCSGWAEVWRINESLMREEAGRARAAHDDGRADRCEVEASRYAWLRGRYERTADRFWEPLPTDAPAPPELR